MVCWVARGWQVGKSDGYCLGFPSLEHDDGAPYGDATPEIVHGNNIVKVEMALLLEVPVE